jgi:hypothetical protein
MVIHLPHVDGVFGVTFNDITKDSAFYTTTSHFVSWLGVLSQEHQGLWLPKDGLKDPSSWSSPPVVLLRDIYSGCGWTLDVLGDHVSTCTAHSGSKRLTIGQSSNSLTYFAQHIG